MKSLNNFLGLSLVLLLFFSCRKEAGIELLKVDSVLPHKKIVEEVHEPGQMAKLDPRVNLIMGVVVPTANHQWFIKIAGPFDEFEKVKPMFEKIKETIKFDDYSVEVVTTELAEGWTMKKEKGFIHSSLTHPDLVTKITISSAKGSLLENVNRWNKQLGMADISEIDLTQIVSKVNMNGHFGLVVVLFKREVAAAQEPVGNQENKVVENPHKTNEPVIAAKGMRMAFGVVGERSWFIKMSGDANTLILQKNNFEAFAKSFQFNGEEKPKWEVPAGWEKTADKPMSVGTYSIGDAVVTVTPLGADFGSLEMNVNRWRGQIGLSSATAEEIAKSLQKIVIGGTEFNYLFITNSTDEQKPAVVKDEPVNEAAETSENGITYKKPVTWEYVKPTMMRKVNLKASGMEVTGIFLGEAAKGVEKNVERWCQQIGMSKLSEADLAKAVKQIPFNGKENGASSIVLDGESQAILAVIYETADGVWFFKVMGKSELIKSEQKNFENFVNSIKIVEEK